MEGEFHIFGIAGSIRRASWNRGLLRAAAEMLPEGAMLDTRTIDDIPLFNEDIEAVGDPPQVVDLKGRIARADAVLIAAPEYNYSIPGVLKNAIDWVARPAATTVLRNKPVGLIGASVGQGGTIRSQLALRQVFVFTGSLVLVHPEFMVSFGTDKFDAEGNLLDDGLREQLRALVAALVDWGRLVSRPGVRNL